MDGRAGGALGHLYSPPRGPSHARQPSVPGWPLPGVLDCSGMTFVGSTTNVAGLELRLCHRLWDIEEVISSLHASFSSSGK